MIKPDPRVVKAMAVAVRQHPELLEWIAGWRRHELDQLQYAVNQPALCQGRCQVLSELEKFATDAPQLAAKL